MRQVDQLRETWDSDSFELISDFFDVGERVAVRFIWQTVGHGPESNIELTGVYIVRKGRSSPSSSSGITRRPSKPRAFGVGDVAGEVEVRDRVPVTRHYGPRGG